MEVLQRGSSPSWKFFRVEVLQSGSSSEWKFFGVKVVHPGCSPTWKFFNVEVLQRGSYLMWKFFDVKVLQPRSSPTWKFYNVEVLYRGSSSEWKFFTMEVFQHEKSLIVLNFYKISSKKEVLREKSFERANGIFLKQRSIAQLFLKNLYSIIRCARSTKVLRILLNINDIFLKSNAVKQLKGFKTKKWIVLGKWLSRFCLVGVRRRKGNEPLDVNHADVTCSFPVFYLQTSP